MKLPPGWTSKNGRRSAELLGLMDATSNFGEVWAYAMAAGWGIFVYIQLMAL
jgi:hypothetical protein